ncbi:MAG: helix-turn-helix domain-containing protein [Bacteroidota bacterium]
MESISETLTNAMNDGLYFDPNLTVKIAAKKLGIPQRVLSQHVNQDLHKSFNDYVNSYRVDEVKRKLTDQKYEHLTIASIAYDSGFRSIATFQRAFRRMEGLSPVEYKNKSKNNPQIAI